MYYVASSVNGRARLLPTHYLSTGAAWRIADKANANHGYNGHQCDDSCVHYFACDSSLNMVDRPPGSVDVSNPDPDREIRSV